MPRNMGSKLLIVSSLPKEVSAYDADAEGEDGILLTLIPYKCAYGGSEVFLCEHIDVVAYEYYESN